MAVSQPAEPAGNAAKRSIVLKSDAWLRLAHYVHEAEGHISREMSRLHGLGVTEYRALCLLQASANSELRMQDLASRLHLNQSSVTRLVERLERSGLTVRDTCPADKRGIYTVLTPEGRTAHSKAKKSYEALVDEVLAKPDKSSEPMVRVLLREMT